MKASTTYPKGCTFSRICRDRKVFCSVVEAFSGVLFLGGVDGSATAIGIGWLVGWERGSLLLGGLLAVNEGGWCFLLVYIIIWASGGDSRSTLPILIERIGNRRVKFNRVII